MDGGVWLHRHVYRGEPMIHLVSGRREPLQVVGDHLGYDSGYLQYKPLKDPRTGVRVDAWHWDLWGERKQRLEALLEAGQ